MGRKENGEEQQGGDLLTKLTRFELGQVNVFSRCDYLDSGSANPCWPASRDRLLADPAPSRSGDPILAKPDLMIARHPGNQSAHTRS